MKKKTELIQSAEFLIPLMMIGGFMDTYTWITRDGVFANNQTGNMAMLGIALSQKNWVHSIEIIIPLLSAIFGALVASNIKSRLGDKRPTIWQETILLLQGIMFIIVGFVPSSFPNIVVNSFMTFVSTFQLSAFRILEGVACNTTISTGNLRSIGQLWSESYNKRDKESKQFATKYTFVVMTFVLGSLLGALASVKFGGYAIWICAIALFSLRIWLYKAPDKENLMG